MKTASLETPSLGDRAFEVEWITELPTIEGVGSDWDRAEYAYEIVKTKAAAMRLAKKVCPELPVEVVTVTPVEFTDTVGAGIPHHFEWESCGDKLHYTRGKGFDEDAE